MSDGGSLVLYEQRGRAAWLTLNRPAKLNALSTPLIDELDAALDRAAADDAVRVVVLTGAGRAFSAGFDLTEEVADDPPTAAEWRAVLARDIAVTMKLWSMSKPTIAAVRGWCLAGGLELALAADILVAADDARLGEPEIRYGSGPVTLLLPFIVGQRKARELLLTGDAVDAAEAHRIGLVNRVVSGDELEGEVEALVARIAPTPLEVLRLTKIALNRAAEAMGVQEAVNANLELSSILNAAAAPEQVEFDRIVRERGLKEALRWRDERYADDLGAGATP